MRRNITLLGLVCAMGCAFIKPTTEVVFSPRTGDFRLTNTKDVTVRLGEIEVRKEADGTFSLRLISATQPALELDDLSSPVITANVQQMLAFAEQQRAANEGIIGSLKAIGDMVGVLSTATASVLRGSGIQVDTPYGSGTGWLTTQPAETGGGLP